ncbi:MAG TPA: hypothetical protein ENK43_15725 [Planctomycetes bacterium]|nr:hypothetical protein [Planctomycetota bacterium]
MRDSAERDRRLKAIRSLITRAKIASQSDLADRLRSRGFEVTQSSVSRDLKALGVAKVGGRYVLPLAGGLLEPEDGELNRVATAILRLRPAGPNLLVLHTDVGSASRVALALDRTGWTEIAGTLAGDDTIFIAVEDLRARKRLERRLRDIMGDAR